MIKSPNDNREYLTFLLDNKLRVYVITDRDIQSAHVSLLIKVGYFYDNIPGVAHLLEHMVFNGTKRFPEESAFSSLISKYNGNYNAYTSYDHTCYYFSVSENGFLPVLENFGDMFIDPNLDKNSIDREKESVNSEHVKNISSDMWRSHEVIKAGILENHPIRNFGCGNSDTLNDKDISTHVRNFFQKYYSSELMTLIVITSLDNVTVTSNIKRIFSKITIKKFPENQIPDKILNGAKLIKYVPLENANHLSLIFELPYWRDPIVSPHEFLTLLIKNESKNSLHCTLSSHGYITEFTASIREKMKTNCLFEISMQLSPYGQKHKRTLFGTIMSFIELLKENIDSSLLEQLWNDELELKRYKFKYLEKCSPPEYASYLGDLINDYDIDPLHINTVSILQTNFSNIKENLKKCLYAMTIDNVVVSSGSKEYENIAKYEYPFYGTKYTIENKVINYNKIITPLNLPIRNPFISTEENFININEKSPILVHNRDYIRSYWHPMTEFGTPEVSMITKIELPESIDNVYTNTCFILYLNSLLTEIKCEIYLCNMSSYDLKVSYDMGDLLLELNGNYSKFYEISKFLIESLRDTNLITEKSFITSKYALMHDDSNLQFDAPYEKTFRIFKKIVSKYTYDDLDRKEIIDRVTKDDMIREFKKIFFNKKILLYVAGNCDKALFQGIHNVYESLFLESNSNFTNKYMYTSPLKNEIYRFINKNKIEDNVAVSMHVYLGKYDFDKTARIECIINIIDNLLSPEYFDQLRTKEMFGYIVRSTSVKIQDKEKLTHYYYNFLIQTPNKTTVEITQRTKKFISSFIKNLENLSDIDFNVAIKSYMSILTDKFHNLSNNVSYIFSTQLETGLMDDYREIIKKECVNISKIDIIDFYLEKFIKNPVYLIIQLDKEQSDIYGGGKKMTCNNKNCMNTIKTKKYNNLLLKIK
jgi:insulysin